ncbi:MAG TPA: pilus assembly protein [Phycisphaerae bacterium]|nr:pilus assembly protein [Phycisphaerae bacterium]HNU43770.1 pilus assembly protein [Phycisphaerae bacterium]
MRSRLFRATLRRGVRRARGGAVVEFAVVLPLLLMLLFGIIECGWVFMMRQTIQNAAREGCRVAVLQTATEGEISARINELLNAAGMTTHSITLQHADGLTTCDESVSITIAYDDVSLVGGILTLDTLEGTCTMRKEGCVLSGG